MKALMNQLRESAVKAILNADSPENLEALRVKYLGKKGELTAILKQMGKLSAEERPVMGQLANQIRAELESAIDETRKKLEAAALEARLELETVDVTVPGEDIRFGHKHPMYKALDEIKEIFVGMGFTVLDGPEGELATYNFDKLNAEEGHPSRDWSDTFYFDKDSRVMLRSQTSPMQVRAMETMKLPIRIVAPGRVYRKDEVDATHSTMFHQIEGMVIDKNVTMADLKGTLNTVDEQLYGKGTKPSGEVQIIQDIAQPIDGRDLLIDEDILDSGVTLHYLMQILAARGANSIRLCTLLSKPERRKIQVDVDYLGFEIPDEFVVGYGLDYAEKYRNLPYIGILKPYVFGGE